MKRVSIVLLGLAGLMPVCVSAASVTVLPAQEASSTQYTLGEASTLRLISRAYFPDSASTRSFFIRRIAAANPTVFSRNQQQVFDQSLARGQKLMVPAGLLPSSTAASFLLPLVSVAPVADVRVHAQLKITGAAALAEVEVEGLPVSLQSFASLMAGADEMIRAHRLEEDIAEQGVQGAKGIYEPFVIASMEREGMFIPTSAQDKLQQGYQNTYRMIENRLKTGLLFKAPTGADIEYFGRTDCTFQKHHVLEF